MKGDDKMAVIGMAELPTGWFPDKSCIDAYIEVTRAAILDAGIHKKEIDAFIVLPPLSMELDEHEVMCGRIVEELGLNGVKFLFQTNAGGSSTVAAKIAAKGLLTSGAAQVVLVSQAQAYSRVTGEEMRRFFSTNSGHYEEWEYPYGMTYNNMVALVAQRYMYETGLTEEQRASLAVSLRQWAELNPHARFRKPMSVEDVLNSKMVSTPLHAYECNVLSDGAGAFILTRADRAASMGKKPPVYILAEGHGGISHFSMIQKPDKDFTRMGYDKAAKIAFEKAGITVKDIDVAEIYGSYPILDLIEFEDIGFARWGEGGAMYANGDTSPGGKIPVNTNGEIQQGHSGLGVGMATFLEGVRQIRGEAGERQVKDAKICLVADTGGQVMDSHVTILGRELI
jgi:acetyl-CoA acetyltransferase